MYRIDASARRRIRARTAFTKTLTARASACCLFLVLLALISAPVSAQSVDEYEVKSAFLFNFTKFIEWPPTPGLSAFTICIFGDDPFGSTINRLSEGKTALGKQIQIRRIKDFADINLCQIAFVSALERSKDTKLIEAARGISVLTVGERKEFLEAGGMIYLSMEENRASLVINTAAAQGANLKISAKLLTLARIFKDGKILSK